MDKEPLGFVLLNNKNKDVIEIQICPLDIQLVFGDISMLPMKLKQTKTLACNVEISAKLLWSIYYQLRFKNLSEEEKQKDLELIKIDRDAYLFDWLQDEGVNLGYLINVNVPFTTTFGSIDIKYEHDLPIEEKNDS